MVTTPVPWAWCWTGGGFGLGERSQRFAIIVEDGVAKQVFVEAGGEFKVSSAEHVLAAL